jgi:hypothetical protein
LVDFEASPCRDCCSSIHPCHRGEFAVLASRHPSEPRPWGFCRPDDTPSCELCPRRGPAQPPAPLSNHYRTTITTTITHIYACKRTWFHISARR